MREWGKTTLALCALLACSGQPRVRAVSLSASTTQVAVALGLADAVTPIDPRAPDALSRALASGTELVLADGGADSADVRALFASRNVAVRSFAPRTSDEVYGAYREIAALLGEPRAGDALAARVGGELERAAAKSGNGARAKVALVLARRPLRVATGDAFLSKLLAAAGADNAFAETAATGSIEIRPEQLAERHARALDVPADLAATAWADPNAATQRLRGALGDEPR